MSTERSRLSDAPSPADIVAGFLATLAIFASLAAIVWHPLRLVPISIVLALLASAMADRSRRLAIAAVITSAVCFFLGMTVAVLYKHPVW